MIEWAFRAYLRNWRQLVILVVVTRGVVSLLYVLAAGSTGMVGPASLLPLPGQPSTEATPAMLLLLGAIAFTDLVFVQPTSTAAIVRAGVGTYLGEPPSADRSIRFGIRRFPSILLVTILVAATLGVLVVPFAVLFAALAAQGEGGSGLVAAVGLGIAAFVVILIAAMRLALVPQAVVAEGWRGRAALRRSWRLTAERFWKVLGVTLVGSFLTGVVTFAITTVASKIAPGSSFPFAVVRGLGSIAAQSVTVPFVALLTSSLFFSVRASKEPFDSGTSLAELRRLDVT
jgi:hypothetical protein